MASGVNGAYTRAQGLSTIVLILTAALLAGLLGRVIWIQRHVGAEEIKKLSAQHLATLPIMPDRGPIYGGDGTIYASSVRMYNLFADPAFIVEPRLNALEPEEVEQAKRILCEALAPLIEVTPSDLQFDIEWNARYGTEAGSGNGKAKRFLWLAREVDEDFYKRFGKLKAELHEKSRVAAKAKDPVRAKLLYHALDGVGFVRSMRRVYPMGQLAGQIIGISNLDGGVDGIEHQLEPMLKGRPGHMTVMKDATRHTLLIEDDRYNPADNGRGIWLTIDTVIQGIAEEELAATCGKYNAEGGTAIVMDPHTGRILAIANWPPFDPGNYRDSRPEDRRDKAVTDPYEPGSIFKPFIMGWALEKGIVRPSDMVDCGAGHWADPTGRIVKDVHGVGSATWAEVLQKSSNVGMAKLGWKMGMPLVHEAVSTFGFGSRTGVELPGDQKGILKPLAQCNKGTLTSMSFGYEVGATPLQLVRAYATFANGGYLVTPRVIHAAEDKPGHIVPWQDLAGPPVQKQILSAKTAETMRTIMEGVYGPHGTAKGKASKIYRFFGKTGTAHLAIRGAAHYAGDQYNSSFLCGGPMSNPSLVGVVTIHKPDRSVGHFGGTVAAPGATRMLERALLYMQVAPDQVEAPTHGTRTLAGRD